MPGNGDSVLPSFSPAGTELGFLSRTSDLGPTDTPPDTGSRDVYVASARGADLSVAVEADPEPVVRGHVLTYELRAGPDRANDAAVALVLPEGTIFRTVATTHGRRDPPIGDRPRAVVVCRLGDLASGEDARVTWP